MAEPERDDRLLRRLTRRLPVILAAALAVVVVVQAIYLTVAVIGPNPVWTLGMDYRYYVSLGERWLTDGTFYLPHQLAGPHDAGLLGLTSPVDTLYPPSALLLFVPLVWLPAVLWWAVPIAVTVVVLVRLRPVAWTWPIMLALLAYPRATGAFLFGNTDMLMMAAVAGGLVWGWPAILVTVKPSLGLLALVGVRHRSWWIAASLGLVFVLLTLPLWLDYVTAMRNLRGLGLGYGLGSLPLMGIPLVAWFGRAGGLLDRLVARRSVDRLTSPPLPSQPPPGEAMYPRG